MSQEALAERARLHWTYISGVERGLRTPGLDVIGRIAAALADEPRLKAVALKLLDQPTDTFTNRALLNELSRDLITGERLQERVRSLGYRMFHLVNTNLMVVSDVGRRRSRQARPAAW